MGIPNIIDFLESKCVTNEHLMNICGGIHFWYDICPFLRKTTVENKELYDDELEEFQQNVKVFYEFGAHMFLTKYDVGDRETSYMHILRYYMPHIAQETYFKHGIGLGAFTMQGFERRNKESKNTLHIVSNHRGNIVVPNMKRLWDIVSHSTTEV